MKKSFSRLRSVLLASMLYSACASTSGLPDPSTLRQSVGLMMDMDCSLSPNRLLLSGF